MPDTSERWRLPCPNCRHDVVHLSHMRWYERLLSWFAIFPYRCYACAHRFRHKRVNDSAGVGQQNGLSDLRATCSHCQHVTRLDLSPVEYHQALNDGWYVSCPKCRVAYVARFK